MQTALVLILGMALSQCLLQIYFVTRWQGRSIQGRLMLTLLLGVMCYLLQPLAGIWLLGVLQTLVPATFWLLCYSLFNDRFSLRGWHVGIVALVVVLPPLAQQGGDTLWLLMRELPRILEFVLVGLALVTVGLYWRDDLVQSRRRLRAVFCALVGGYTFALIFAREFLFGGYAMFDLVQYAATGVVLFVTNVLMLRFDSEIKDLLAPRALVPAAVQAPAPDQSPPVEQSVVAAVNRPEVSAELLAKLDRLMTEDCVYREMGLAIGQLAARLEVPEYRLRQAINTGLGYRNFNDFLNQYRIREAAVRLVSEEEASLPVLTIALDVGFRSLSSFNKAFREAHGMTPTEYRKRHMSA